MLTNVGPIASSQSSPDFQIYRIWRGKPWQSLPCAFVRSATPRRRLHHWLLRIANRVQILNPWYPLIPAELNFAYRPSRQRQRCNARVRHSAGVSNQPGDSGSRQQPQPHPPSKRASTTPTPRWCARSSLSTDCVEAQLILQLCHHCPKAARPFHGDHVVCLKSRCFRSSKIQHYIHHLFV